MSEQPRRRRRQRMPTEGLQESCVQEHAKYISDTEMVKEYLHRDKLEQRSPSGYQIEYQKGANGLSIAGFVVSLVSLFILALYGITGTIGLVLSAVGRSQAVNEGRKTGLATAGIVLGIISIMGGIVNAFIYL